MLAFISTCFLLHKLGKYLPQDQGREFAHDGKLSAGKPRGAGIVFILTFSFAILIFGRLSTEMVIYLALIVASMLSGYLDDCAKHPWGEYKKGLLDLLIAIMTAVTYLNYNGNSFYLVSIDKTVTL